LDEFRFQARDNDVASERDVATGASGNAVHRCDNGKGDAPQSTHERIVVSFLRATERNGLTWFGKPVAQILARAETTARAGYQQGAAAFIGFGIVYRLAESQMHRFVESVELVGSVQRNDAITGARID
jgi:hypothetical protein